MKCQTILIVALCATTGLPAWALSSEELNKEGIKCCNQNQLDKAIKFFTQAIEADPKHTTGAIGNRAAAYSQKGEFQNAITDFTTASKLHPHDSKIFYNRGQLKIKMGDKQGALEDFSTAIKLKPTDVEAYNNRGTVKNELGDTKGALADYEQAISINPKYPDVWIQRGYLEWKQLHQTKQALASFEKAIAVDAKFVPGYVNRARLRTELGDKPQALSDYKTAASLLEQRGDAAAASAVTKESLGQP